LDAIKFCPAGDCALIAEFGNRIDEDINSKVHALARWISERKIPGVIETVPTFRSLMVIYDPWRISYRRLTGILKKCSFESRDTQNTQKEIIEVPCWYSGPDMDDMEKLTGLSREEIISIHSGTDYKIYMMGFLPGFVYLGGLDERIHAPRLSTPRTRIEPGSVGIGGSQTGVYPVASPGGWRILGYTPLKFYDPEKENPILCRAGQYIRFVPISREEYERAVTR